MFEDFRNRPKKIWLGGWGQIERRLVHSMRNCVKQISSLVTRSETLKNGMFLKIFEIVKNRIFDHWLGFFEAGNFSFDNVAAVVGL